jgi:2-keto-3-deoxy-L-rhamnonate aldolase RhmA
MGATIPFTLTLLSRDPAWIEAADAAGVERIGIDIELIGKANRQSHVAGGTRISGHTLADLRTVTPLVQHALPFVRVNPPNLGTRNEVEEALALGARSLMLPYFRSVQEAARFVELVAGRAEVVLLVETGAALARLHDMVRIPGVDEIMVGMNDLHIDLRLASPMEIAASELLHTIAGQVREAGIRFGFGAVARPESEDLPVPSDLLLARYARLGARSALISRSFFRGGLTPSEMNAALARLRSRLAFWFAQPPEALAAAERELHQAVRRLGSNHSTES